MSGGCSAEGSERYNRQASTAVRPCRSQSQGLSGTPHVATRCLKRIRIRVSMREAGVPRAEVERTMKLMVSRHITNLPRPVPVPTVHLEPMDQEENFDGGGNQCGEPPHSLLLQSIRTSRERPGSGPERNENPYTRLARQRFSAMQITVENKDFQDTTTTTPARIIT